MTKAPPAKAQSAQLQSSILNFVLLDALNGAFSLAQRTRDAAPLKAYLRERTLLIAPVVVLMAFVSISCAASMVMFLGGTSSLLVLLSMVALLDHRLEFLAGVECDNPAGRDRDLLAGLGIAAGTLRLVPQLKVAETGQLHAFSAFQRLTHLLEEGLDHVLGLALVQPDLLEQQVGKVGFGERHGFPLLPELGTVFLFQDCEQTRNRGIDLWVGKSLLSILQ